MSSTVFTVCALFECHDMTEQCMTWYVFDYLCVCVCMCLCVWVFVCVRMYVNCVSSVSMARVWAVPYVSYIRIVRVGITINNLSYPNCNRITIPVMYCMYVPYVRTLYAYPIKNRNVLNDDTTNDDCISYEQKRMTTAYLKKKNRDRKLLTTLRAHYDNTNCISGKLHTFKTAWLLV
jgi:hypothetical protein